MKHERDCTIEELIATATQPTRDNTLGSARTMEDSWAGESFTNAVAMAKEGDPHAAAQLQQLQSHPSIHEALRPTLRWSDAGSQVDIGAFLAGEQDCMGEVVRMKRPSQVLKIAVERAVNAGVNTNTIRAVGASVLAVVEALRTQGVSAEVWATFTVRSRNAADDVYQLRVLVQEAGRPISIDVLAYWLVNPSTLRRLCFAYQEQEPMPIRTTFGFVASRGYGSALQYPTDYEGFDEVAPASQDKVTAWIQEVLERRGR